MERGRRPELVLRLHHFITPAAHAHRNFLKPWSDHLASVSDGRICIEITPLMQLGGRPSELFDQARDGAVDLVWTLPSYTPGRFPRMEVFELPFIASRSAKTTSRALQSFAEGHLGVELAEVHPICLWTHDYGVISSKREIRSVEELRGLKIRYLTAQQGNILRRLGAEPISMPILPAVAAFAAGDIDGCILPWEGVRAFGVLEHATSYTEFPFTPTLYTQIHMLVMNRDRYSRLPSDLRSIIDSCSGVFAASMGGQAWDDEAPKVRAVALARGHRVHTLAHEENERWKSVTEPIINDWLKKMEQNNCDGGALLTAAREAIAFEEPQH